MSAAEPYRDSGRDSSPPPIEIWSGGEEQSATAGIPHRLHAPSGAAHGEGGRALPVTTPTLPLSTRSPRGGEPLQSAVDRLRDLPEAQQHAPAESFQPLVFDFDKEPEPPCYVVDRLFERQTVNVLSGDTGAGKSIVMSSLIVAVCMGSDWLGHEVSAQRVVIVDEENSEPTVRTRLWALGLRTEHAGRLRYFNREGFTIGDRPWTGRLMRAAREHRADLIIIDTAGAATNAEVNDNDAVVGLYRDALRPIATELNAAVVILHHERKSQVGQSRDPGQAMMGARQWAAQADTHLSLKVTEQVVETPGADGHRELRSERVMRMPKNRHGEPDVPQRIAIESTKDGRRLLTMRVITCGRYEKEPTKAVTLAEEIADLLRQRGEMKTQDIQRELKAGKSTLYDALRKALADGKIVKPGQGRYAPAPTEPAL